MMRTTLKRVCEAMSVGLVAAVALSAQVTNIHTTFGGDPRTEVTISWRGATPSSVAYGTTTSYGSSASGFVDGTHRHVLLTGLTPGTTYYYECGEESGATGSFKTAPSGTPDFSFAVLGDVQGKDAVSAAFQNQAAWYVEQDPPFWIPVGDLVDEGQTQSHWDAFYTSGEVLSTSTVIMPVRGNHERYWAKNTGDECNGLYMEQFNMPPNGDAAYYWFEYGDALFVILDGGCADGDAQRAWMESLFQTNTKMWRFVFIHTPFYCTGGHGGADLNALTNALIEQYEVNAAFSGHSHSLSVNYPIHDGQIVGSYADGVLYYNTAGTNYNSDRDDATEAKPYQSYLQPPNGQDPYPHSNAKPLATMVHVTGSTVQVVTHDYYNRLILHTVDLPARRSTATGRAAPMSQGAGDVAAFAEGRGGIRVRTAGNNPWRVAVLDLNGRVLHTSVSATQPYAISGLPSGMCVLQAESAGLIQRSTVAVR